jgi:GT2 family glycosyltransferase
MKQRNKKIIVITVNYNNAALTEDCLKSFKGINKDGIDLTLLVVDCGSVEEESRNLNKKFPKVKFIFSKKNLGFAGGNNLGLDYAKKMKADFVLLINNDATVESKDFLQKLLKTKGDIISPKVEYKDKGKAVYDYGGKVDMFFGRNYHLSKNTNIRPDYFSGVCLLIPSVVLDVAGKLDDGFFLYYEDADYCLRAVEKGFCLGFCPSVKIFHHLSMSTNKLGKKKLIILANSHLRFCRRHLPVTSLPFYLLFNLYLRAKTLLP